MFKHQIWYQIFFCQIGTLLQFRLWWKRPLKCIGFLAWLFTVAGAKTNSILEKCSIKKIPGHSLWGWS